MGIKLNKEKHLPGYFGTYKKKVKTPLETSIATKRMKMIQKILYFLQTFKLFVEENILFYALTIISSSEDL